MSEVQAYLVILRSDLEIPLMTVGPDDDSYPAAVRVVRLSRRTVIDEFGIDLPQVDRELRLLGFRRDTEWVADKPDWYTWVSRRTDIAPTPLESAERMERLYRHQATPPGGTE